MGFKCWLCGSSIYGLKSPHDIASLQYSSSSAILMTFVAYHSLITIQTLTFWSYQATRCSQNTPYLHLCHFSLAILSMDHSHYSLLKVLGKLLLISWLFFFFLPCCVLLKWKYNFIIPGLPFSEAPLPLRYTQLSRYSR